MKKFLSILPLIVFMFISGQLMSQSSSCCSDSKKSKTTASCEKGKGTVNTSGCAPSACRGIPTKFGEAKVITALRHDLIDLKAVMETYSAVSFDERSYSVHRIVGDTDDESIAIIADEIRIIEGSFASLLKKTFAPFSLPDKKARQVVYLKERISALASMLKA